VKPLIPPRLEAAIRSRLGVSGPPPVNTPSAAGGCDPSDIRGATSHARRRREKHVDAPRVMLSDAEIKRALLRYRFDRQFRGPRRVPIKTLADFVGLSHETPSVGAPRAFRRRCWSATAARARQTAHSAGMSTIHQIFGGPPLTRAAGAKNMWTPHVSCCRMQRSNVPC
jgi:hypothetical protein